MTSKSQLLSETRSEVNRSEVNLLGLVMSYASRILRGSGETVTNLAGFFHRFYTSSSWF